MSENKVIMRERKRWLFFGIPWTFTKYTITEKKLIIESGLLKSSENEILMYRIKDMSMTRTLVQKIFGLGTLTVYAHDKTNPVLVIKNIKHVRDFKEALSDAVEHDKLRMKLRQSEMMLDNDADVDGVDEDWDDGE